MTTPDTAREEIIRELSDKIWNLSGVHTHNELDAMIGTALDQFKFDLLEEMAAEIEADLVLQAHGSFTGRDGMKRAASLLRHKRTL